MFSVSDDFLKEEVREGFTVPEKMKRAWAASMKTLVEVSKLFKKYDIKYFADYGTLLGAIRHGGFIPWDDDIDIGMLREDYMKFVQVMDELPEPFLLKTIYSDRPFSQFHGVISNTREEKLTYNKDRIRDFFGCPFIIGIDIVQYDYIPRDPNAAKLQELMYYMGYSLSMDYEKTGITPEFMDLLGQFNSRLGISLDVNAPDFITQVRRVTDRVAMFCGRDDADVVAYYPQNAYLGSATKIPKEYFDELVEVPFENITIPVPKKSHEVLSLEYGENYMTPIRSYVAHGYPFYESQEEYFNFLGIEV